MASKNASGPPAGPAPAHPPRRRPDAASLSVDRAFVVHLGPRRGRRSRYRGRVEHLTTGRATTFSSLADLVRFFDVVADDPTATP